MNAYWTVIRDVYDSDDIDEMSSDAFDWMETIAMRVHAIDYPGCPCKFANTAADRHA